MVILRRETSYTYTSASGQLEANLAPFRSMGRAQVTQLGPSALRHVHIVVVSMGRCRAQGDLLVEAVIAQLAQQRLGLLEVEGTEAFGEPAADSCEEILRIASLAALGP